MAFTEPRSIRLGMRFYVVTSSRGNPGGPVRGAPVLFVTTEAPTLASTRGRGIRRPFAVLSPPCGGVSAGRPRSGAVRSGPRTPDHPTIAESRRLRPSSLSASMAPTGSCSTARRGRDRCPSSRGSSRGSDGHAGDAPPAALAARVDQHDDGPRSVDHTILDFTRFNPATGTKEPITSDERREPAVWNMASWAGRRCGGRPVGHVSRRAGERHARVGPSVQLPLQGGPAATRYRLSRGAGGVGSRSPARGRAAIDYLREYLPWLDEKEYAARARGREPYAHPVSALRRILVETRVYDRGDRDREPRQPDLAILYIQGTDSIGHVFASFAPPRQPECRSRTSSATGRAAAVLPLVDELLGDTARSPRRAPC